MCRRFTLLPPSAFVRSLCTPACVYNEPLRKMSGVGSLPYSHVTITCSILVSIIIKHIRAKPSALSQNLSQLLARMRRRVRVMLSTRAQLPSYSRPRPAHKALGVVASSKVKSYVYVATSLARHVKHHAS